MDGLLVFACCTMAAACCCADCELGVDRVCIRVSPGVVGLDGP